MTSKSKELAENSFADAGETEKAVDAEENERSSDENEGCCFGAVHFGGFLRHLRKPRSLRMFLLKLKLGA